MSDANGDVAHELSLTQLLEDGLFIDGDWVESKDQDPNGEVRLIQLADVGDGVFRDRSSRFLTKERAKELRCTFLEPGDVLVARMPDPLGRACIFPGVGQPAVTAVDVCILRPNPSRARADWLVNAMNSPHVRSAMEEFIRGTTRQRISRKNLGKLMLRVPPLDVQTTVALAVNRIEAKRGSAVRHVAAARAVVERFRLAVLDAACAGRLTADWRAERGLVDGSDLPASWTHETVESLAADVPRAIQSGPFGSNLLHSEFQPTGKLVVGIDNVLDGRFSTGSQHRISQAKFTELQRYEARPNDVLITVMATVGRVCVLPSDIEPAIITKHVYRITVDQGRVVPNFLMQAMRGHPRVREQIHHQTRGQTRPGINGKIVKALVISLPSLEEQREILQRIDRLLATAARLTEHIESTSSTLQHLSKASLSRAFRGELPPVEVS